MINNLMNPLKISCNLFKELEEAEVRHCHWKSNQHLDDALAGQTDMDLLVDKDQARLCESILTNLGYKRLISQPWIRYPGIENWLGFDEESGELVHVHLHYQLLSGIKFVKEQHLPWENLILNTAIKDTRFNVYITDPNLEIILLVIRVGLKTSFFQLLHSSLDNYVLPKNILNEFDYLLGQSDENLVHEYTTELLKDEYGQKIWAIIRQRYLGKPGTIWKTKLLIHKALGKHRRYSQVNILILHLINYLYYFLSKVQRKLGFFSQSGKRLHSGGVIIAVIGCDGAGKSTISREIQQWLSWKIDSHQMYLGSGDGSIGLPIKLLRFLASFRSYSQAKSEMTDNMPADGNRKKSWFRELGSYLLDLSIANDRYKKMLRANQVRLNGGIVITDRFPQNQFIGIYDGPRISKFNGNNSRAGKYFTRREEENFRKMAKLAPDIVIKLHVPNEVALSRKPDHHIDKIRRKIEITRKLEFNGAKVIDINASKPIEEVIKSLKKEVWESL